MPTVMERFPDSSGLAAFAAISSAFSATRASPDDSVTSALTASGSNSSAIVPSPCSLSLVARRIIASTCSAVWPCSVNTRQRESRGEFTSNDGFSVVAPISTTVPFST